MQHAARPRAETGLALEEAHQMANSRTTQQRGERQNAQGQGAQRSSAPQGSTDGGDARQGNEAQGGDRERGIRTSREGETGRSMARGRSSSIAPVYGSSLATSPFGLMRRMAEDMDRILEDFGFAGPGFAVAPLLSPTLERGRGSTMAGRPSAWTPSLETFRRGDNLVVRADLPGLRKEDVQVEIDDGVLTISGERSEEQVENRDDYYRSERSYGRFHRALPLPEGITGDACEATFEHGVLEVTLPMPKQAKSEARKIAIR
jgi:HSP20 family protein